MFVFINARRIRKAIIAALALICVLIALISLTGGSGAREVWDMAKPSSGITLPVIMYHSVLKSASMANDYTVTSAQLESDLKYLDDHGYVPVVIDDLIQYVYNGRRLPAKPVMITFDDGQLNNLTNAVPLLREYGMKAVISVVGIFIERAERDNDPSPPYAYMTWTDVQKALDSGVVEIQNHSYNLHGGKARMGFTKLAGETQAAFHDSLVSDVTKMQRLLQMNAGVVATCFTYPYGLTCKDSASLLKEAGFKSAMTCQERVNTITADPECLLHLDRFNRSGYTTTEKFMKKLGIK